MYCLHYYLYLLLGKHQSSWSPFAKTCQFHHILTTGSRYSACPRRAPIDSNTTHSSRGRNRESRRIPTLIYGPCFIGGAAYRRHSLYNRRNSCAPILSITFRQRPPPANPKNYRLSKILAVRLQIQIIGATPLEYGLPCSWTATYFLPYAWTGSHATKAREPWRWRFQIPKPYFHLGRCARGSSFRPVLSSTR